jgi:CRISPR type III-B/RAMP module RAMP protein Cmr1
MKILFDEKMEILTPCFCAGADQSKPEIRTPSIRGELRWWFRALGGSRAEESKLFGSIGAKEQSVEGCASSLVVRNTDPQKGQYEDRSIPSNVKFFVKSRLDKSKNCFIPAGREFHLQIVDTRGYADELAQVAIEAFTRLGALGLRANRGCGAVQSASYRPTKEAFATWSNQLIALGVDIFPLQPENSAYDAWVILEEQIKEFRSRMGIEKNGQNAMGFVQGNKRHASCLKVRPVALNDGSFLPLFIYSEVGLAPRITSILPELRAFFA